MKMAELFVTVTTTPSVELTGAVTLSVALVASGFLAGSWFTLSVSAPTGCVSGW